MIEILLCPVCRGKAEIIEKVLWVYSEYLYEYDAYIECTLCGAHCKSFRNDKNAAIFLWNTRNKGA